MTHSEPTLDQLAGILRSCSQERADTSLANLLGATGGTIDLTLSAHRNHLRRWLNKWVCRLRYPRPGEPDIFADSLLQWWPASGAALPSCPIAELTDTEIATIADSYEDLSARPGALLTRSGVVKGFRRIGPTAASKTMFILRRDTVQPWDATIARSTTEGTTSTDFASHLKAARAWALGLQNEARRRHIPDIGAHVGRPNSSMAKLRDEWMYLTITRRCPVPPVLCSTRLDQLRISASGNRSSSPDRPVMRRFHDQYLHACRSVDRRLPARPERLSLKVLMALLDILDRTMEVLTKAGLARTISPFCVLRIPAEHPVKPWQYWSRIFPHDPGFAARAAVILDLH